MSAPANQQANEQQPADWCDEHDPSLEILDYNDEDDLMNSGDEGERAPSPSQSQSTTASIGVTFGMLLVS